MQMKNQHFSGVFMHPKMAIEKTVITSALHQFSTGICFGLELLTHVRLPAFA
jgi:hypothetical protein